MAVRTLSSGTKTIPYMSMTVQAIPCPAPVLENDFDSCRIPGGLDLWWDGGFYSPGECFVGYRAMCTQTVAPSEGWPIEKGETAVRCIPVGYECNDQAQDQRYAISDFDGTILSAPAFEIRWRSEDLKTGSDRLRPGAPTLGPMPSGPPPRPDSSAARDSLSASSSSLTLPVSSSATPKVLSATSSSRSRPGSSSFVPTPSAVAGIVVGSCLGVVAIVSVVIFSFVQHRRRRHESPARLSRDPWESQGPGSGSVQIVTHVPVELEDKPTEPRELSAETQSHAHSQSQAESPFQTWDPSSHRGADDASFILKIPHISVNSSPAEVAADVGSGAEKRPSGEAGSPASTTGEEQQGAG